MAVNTSEIRYAVKITTEHVGNIAEIGLYNGEIRMITGRDATGLTFEGGESADNFRTGFLVKSPIKSMGTEIDISLGGAMASLNTCSITINNTDSYMTLLLSNKVYLANCKVQIYVAIDGVLYSRFGGVISEISYNEKYVVLKARDVNEDNFKNIPENGSSQVVYGDFTTEPLPLKLSDDNVSTITRNGTRYEPINNVAHLTVAITKEDYDTNLGTPDFWAGRHVKPREFRSQNTSEGIEDAIQIISNTQPLREEFTDGYGVVRYIYSTRLELEVPFASITSKSMIPTPSFFRLSSSQYKPDIPTSSKSPFLYNFTEFDGIVVFDIISFESQFTISDSEVESIETDENGNAVVYTYSDEYGYVETDKSFGLVNDGQGSHVVCKSLSKEFNARSHTVIPFKSCRFASIKSVSGNDFYIDPIARDKLSYQSMPIPSVFYDGSVFINGDYGTEENFQDYTELESTFKRSTDPEGFFTASLGALFELEVQDNFEFDSYSSVYFSFGIRLKVVNTINDVAERDLHLNFNALNIAYADYGYPGYSGMYAERKIIPEPISSSSLKLMTYDEENGNYYSPFALQAQSDDVFPVSQVIVSPKRFDSNTTISPTAVYSWGGSFNEGWIDGIYYAGTDEYLGVVSVDQVIQDGVKLSKNPVVTDPKTGKRKIYLHVTVDPKDGNINTDYNVKFDLFNIQLIGEKEVKSENLYVKAVGEQYSGVGSGSVYGVFKNALEAKNSFTDVNYGNVQDTRTTWDASRVLQEQTNSKDLIKELAQQSFVGVFTNRKGNLQLSAFKDLISYDYNTEGEFYYWAWKAGVAYRTFDSSNIINGSIGSVKQTPTSNIYNNIALRYGYSYATGKFRDDTYYVTNVAEYAFPAFGDDYSKFSNIPDYTSAKISWEHAHSVYVTNRISKSIDKAGSLRDCYWFNKNTLNSSLYFYLVNLTEWVTQSKNKIAFSLPINSDTITIDLLEPCIFNDVLLTGGYDVAGWVTKTNIDSEKMVLNVEITTVPTELIPVYKLIDEGSETILDVTVEEVDSTDAYDEDFSL